MTIKTLDEKVFGYRIISGTMWPWVYQLQRVESAHKVSWQIIAVNNCVCNQVVGTYKKLKDARTAFLILREVNP